MNISWLADTSPADRAFDDLRQLLEPVGLSQFMKQEIEPFIKMRARDRFRTEGDEVTGAWQQLTETTKSIREYEGYPGDHPINKRTGRLEEYIIGSTGDFASAGSVSIWTYPGTPATGMLETKVRTAQEGKAKPRTPARPVLALGTRDLMYVLGRMVVRLESAG